MSNNEAKLPHDHPVVQMKNIEKRFGSVVANDGVDFDLWVGEIHVLLGENGAGKTTLANILFGHLRPDSGTVRVRHEDVSFDSPRDALDRGIGMVHQHFSLVPVFSVAENVMLGSQSRSASSLRPDALEDEVRHRAAEVGMSIDPARKVSTLPVDLQQRVEILKVLFRGARILILDEPTSLLGPAEIENLFGILRGLRSKGHSILLVTHKLAEVMQIADRVTVLRQGRKVHLAEKGSFDEASLARAMTGRDLPDLPNRRDFIGRSDSPLLDVRGLAAGGRGSQQSLSRLDLSLYAGEILAVAGVEGNGQRELVEILSGLKQPEAGSVLLNGRDVTSLPPSSLRSAGLGIIPEDRHGWGLAPSMSLAENLALSDIPAGRLSRRGLVLRRLVQERARKLLEEFDVRPSDPRASALSLSGGNQQKLVLARELAARPTVLLADNPTWGLDVGAIQYVHMRLLEMRERGCGVLLVSLDLDEIFKLGDRVMVLFRGRPMLEAPVGDVTVEDIGVAMAGTQIRGDGTDPAHGTDELVAGLGGSDHVNLDERSRDE